MRRGKAQPAATSADIDYLLRHVNDVLATPLTRDDIVGVYAGLRPLISGWSSLTTKLSREHVMAFRVRESPSSRAAAHHLPGDRRDVVTAVLESTGTRSFPSATADIPLIGAEGHRFATAGTREALAARGFSTAPVTRFVDRCGSLAPDVVEVMTTTPHWPRSFPDQRRAARRGHRNRSW